MQSRPLRQSRADPPQRPRRRLTGRRLHGVEAASRGRASRGRARLTVFARAASRGRLRRIPLATSIIGKDSGIPSALPAHQPRGVRAGSWFVVGTDERDVSLALRSHRESTVPHFTTLTSPGQKRAGADVEKLGECDHLVPGERTSPVQDSGDRGLRNADLSRKRHLAELV
jgi:hypothetical protein